MIDDLFDDDWELENFAIVGGLIGFVEEELEEETERMAGKRVGLRAR